MMHFSPFILFVIMVSFFFSMSAAHLLRGGEEDDDKIMIAARTLLAKTQYGTLSSTGQGVNKVRMSCFVYVLLSYHLFIGFDHFTRDNYSTIFKCCELLRWD
jgi:hypothetical protein